ncbi:MAG: hypothetical protein JJU13_04920 [Balneolaceae bacterium]|nr:hypothetical protein [Balneolaceae bacterium]
MNSSKKAAYSMLIVLILVIFSGAGFAQVADNSMEKNDSKTFETPSAFMIDESNLHCFRDMNCLKNDKTIREKGLKFNFNTNSNADHYILEGYSPNEVVKAKYNEQGRLIEAELVHINIRMPREIITHIFSGVYSDWQMVKNERIVQDFDVNTTEFRVMLQKQDEIVVLNFDKDGNRVHPFAGL